MLLSFINFSYSLRFPCRHSFARQHPPTAAAIKQKEPLASLRNKAPSRARRFSSSGRFVPHLCSFRSGGGRNYGRQVWKSSFHLQMRRATASARRQPYARREIIIITTANSARPAFVFRGRKKTVRSPGALLSLIKNASAADESPSNVDAKMNSCFMHK